MGKRAIDVEVAKVRDGGGYRLVFAGVRGQPTISVPTVDPASALILAQRHAQGRPAELWRGDTLVARIDEDEGAGFWRIG